MYHLSRAFHWLDSSQRTSIIYRSRANLSVTRRQVLTGSAAATLSILVPAGPAGNLRILWSRDQILVDLDEQTWVIDRATFGSAARFRYWENAGTHFISVDRALVPGLFLRADFDASLRVISGQWQLSIRMFETTFDVPFLAWLEGKRLATATATGRRYFAGRRRTGSRTAYLECLPTIAAIEITPRWQVRLRGEGAIVSFCLDDLVLQSREVQLTLGARRGSAALDLVKGNTAAGGVTFDLVAPHITAGAARPGQVGSQILTLRFDAITAAHAAITLRDDGSPQTILSVVGEVVASVSARVADEPFALSGLRLAPAGLVASVTRKSEQRLFVATVAQGAHEVDTLDVVLSVAGTDSSRIAVIFENGVSGPVEFTADLYSAAVPVTGADAGRIQFSPIPLDVVIGRDAAEPDVPAADLWLSGYQAGSKPPGYIQASAETPTAAAAEAMTASGLLVIDRTPFFMAPLERNTWLQVLRSQDLLSLKFGFRNFSVEVRNGRAVLVPRSFPAKLLDSETFVHKLLVEFPPQHVAEQAIQTQLGIGSHPAGNLNFRDRTEPPTPKIPTTPDENFPATVMARLSGPTRLVFRIKEGNDPVRKALSVRTLTDWTELAQVVSERAMRMDAPLTDQLAMVGIDSSTNRAEALVRIIQSIRPPRDDETAIEFPYRLILSPDSRAQWITPQFDLGPLHTPTLLWNARLNRSKGGQSVRALWARDILLDFLRGNIPVENDPYRDKKNERHLSNHSAVATAGNWLH